MYNGEYSWVSENGPIADHAINHCGMCVRKGLSARLIQYFCVDKVLRNHRKLPLFECLVEALEDIFLECTEVPTGPGGSTKATM
jgi:hypothetical protein